jgi:hypothetical protein
MKELARLKITVLLIVALTLGLLVYNVKTAGYLNASQASTYSLYQYEDPDTVEVVSQRPKQISKKQKQVLDKVTSTVRIGYSNNEFTYNGSRDAYQSFDGEWVLLINDTGFDELWFKLYMANRPERMYHADYLSDKHLGAVLQLPYTENKMGRYGLHLSVVDYRKNIRYGSFRLTQN